MRQSPNGSGAPLLALAALAFFSLGASRCGSGSEDDAGPRAGCYDDYLGSNVAHGSEGHRRASASVERCTCDDGTWRSCRAGDVPGDDPPRDGGYGWDGGAPVSRDAGPADAGSSVSRPVVEITTPGDGARVMSPVTFGVRGAGIVAVELRADDFPLGPRFDARTTSTVSYAFTRGGARRIVATGFDASGASVATHAISIDVVLPAPARCFPSTVPYQGPGPRQDYGTARGRWHYGVDLTPPIDIQHESGSFPVLAHRGGEVLVSENGGGGSGFGIVRIRHDDGTFARYLHNRRTVVSVGQRVSACDTIAYMGGRGPGGADEYVPHIHFEMENSAGSPVDPVPHIMQSDRRTPRSDIEVRSHPVHGRPRSIGGGL